VVRFPSAASAPGVSSLEFWSRPAAERASTFAQLRHDAPVSFQTPSDFGWLDQPRLLGGDSVRRYPVSQPTPQLYCSGWALEWVTCRLRCSS